VVIVVLKIGWKLGSVRREFLHTRDMKCRLSHQFPIRARGDLKLLSLHSMCFHIATATTITEDSLDIKQNATSSRHPPRNS
jgi:hypothetical protein